MPIEFWTGKPEFEYAHEVSAQQQIIDMFSARFSSLEAYVGAVFNFSCGIADMDLAVFKENGIIIIELKECSKPIKASENGEWLIMDGQNGEQAYVKGGKHGNPFQQVRAYRYALMEYLNEHRANFLSPQKAEQTKFVHIDGVVAISPDLDPNSKIDFDFGQLRWFHLVGLPALAEKAHQIRSKQISLNKSEIRMLIEDVLKCKSLDNKPVMAKMQRIQAEQEPFVNANEGPIKQLFPLDPIALCDFLKESSDAKLRKDAATYLLKVIEEKGEVNRQAVLDLYSAEKDMPVASELRRVINKLDMQKLLTTDPTSEYDRKLTSHEESDLKNAIERLKKVYDKQKGEEGAFDKKYMKLEEIATGGMARLLRGIRIEDNRPIVIKYLMLEKLFTQASPEMLIARFKREGRLLVEKLDHPNILKGYEYGEADGEHYIVLDYIGGGDLNEFILKKSLTYGIFRELTTQLLDAVEYIHKNGIIHRDIKPKNILLDTSLDPARIKLADFGLAKDKDDIKMSRIAFHAYTTPYASPQQRANSADVDERDDIFSLGITLYEVLTGKTTDHDNTYVPVFVESDAASLRINKAIQKCILFEREKRWQSINELRNAIV
jgi:tRNA A-37 threonylcarbamoyl transferase component Bud32